MLQLTYTGANELAWREAEGPGLSSEAAALVRPTAVATARVWSPAAAFSPTTSPAVTPCPGTSG